MCIPPWAGPFNARVVSQVMLAPRPSTATSTPSRRGPGRAAALVGQWAKREWPGLAGVLVLAVWLWWLRGDAILAPGLINPDEAEFLAEAKRTMLSWIPYETSTETTHLYLLPWVLALMGRAGFSLGLPLAHLLSAITYLGLASAAWWCLYRRVGVLVAALGVFAPATALFSARDHLDFLSFSSELVPVACLTAGVFVACGSVKPLSVRRMAFAAVLLGLAPLAKVQALPLALALWAALALPLAAGTVTTNPKSSFFKKSLFMLAFFAAPAAVFIALLVATGKLGVFLSEPIAFQADYALNRGTIQPGGDLGWEARLTGLTTLLPVIPGVLAIALAAGTPRSGSLLLRPWSWHRARARLAIVALGGSMIAGVIGAIAPFPYYPHYSVLVYAGAMLGAVVATSILVGGSSPAPRLPSRGRARAAVPLLVLLATISVVPVLPSVLRAPAWPSGWGQLLAKNETSSAVAQRTEARALLAACPPGQSVYVWGWANELYSYYAWQPASRYVNSIWQYFPLKRQQEYRETLVNELRSQPPRCIVEAVGPMFFGNFPPEATLAATVPATQDLLRRCYRSRHYEGPAQAALTVYVRRPPCAPRTP